MVLLRDQVDVAVLGEAIRAGVREVVAADDADGILAACARSLEVSRQLGAGRPAERRRCRARPRRGKVVTVFAGKGGCGKSTLATNLAVALAAGGARRVCLVDLDLAFGDVAIMLQLVPERSIADAVPMAGRLDETGAALAAHAVRARAWTRCSRRPARPRPSGSAGNWSPRSSSVAREMFDYIVVDTPPFFSDQVLAALDASDCYVLLATPDIPALKNLRLTLDMFDLLEYPKERRLVVLNRADARVGLTAVGHRAGDPRADPGPRAVHPRRAGLDQPGRADRWWTTPSHPVSRAIRELAERTWRGGAESARRPRDRRGKRRTVRCSAEGR